MKYSVVVPIYGYVCVQVEAENSKEAIEYAEVQASGAANCAAKSPVDNGYCSCYTKKGYIEVK